MAPSSLTILYGRSGSGKSRLLYRRLMSHMQKGEPAVLLTAEQSTYEAERELCALCGGLAGGQVLSMSRFSQRVLDEQGVFLPYLSTQGRLMAVRKAALKKQKELTLFAPIAASRGFAAKMDGFITRFKQSDVSPKEVLDTAQKLPEGSLLGMKLHDLGLLYGEVQAFLEDRYLTEGDLWNRARECFPASRLCKSHIYIDGIDLPSRQLFRFLESLLGCCLSMTVSLRLDPKDLESPLFAPDKRTFDRLCNMGEKLGVPLFFHPMDGRQVQGDEALGHLERELFSETPHPYKKETKAVTLCACGDRELEAELLGDRVLSLVRRGYRYRDIAVLMTDTEGYASLVSRAFRRRNIPLFHDAGRPVKGHGAMALLMCALGFCQNGSMEQVLSLMKTGYAGVTQEEGEVFENYVLRYGLFGSALSKPFSYGAVPEAAEKARQTLAQPLLALKEAMGGGATVQERVLGIYKYLETLSLREQLHQKAQALLQAGDAQQAQLHEQVWNVICELLTQMYAILGEDVLPMKEFVSLMEEGAAGYTLGVLPGTADQVLLGDFARTRSPFVPVLFVLGCNEGLLPREHPDDALIDNGELELLQEEGLTLWQGTEYETEFDRLELYTALSRATQSLHLTYAYGGGGEEMAASSLVGDIKELFPGCSQREVLSLSYAPLYEEGGFARLTEDLRLFYQENLLTEDLGSRYAYFSARSPYREALPVLEKSMEGEPVSLRLGKTLSEAMYGQRPLMSASRLELFNRCPFSHYLRYGLLAQERKQSGEQAADAGTFYHEALNAFLILCRQKGLSLKDMEDRTALALVDELLPPLLAAHNDGIFLRDDLLRAGLFLRVETVKQAVLSLLRQVQAGSFVPEAGEVTFGPGQNLPPLKIPMGDGGSLPLYGRIDRLDRDQKQGIFRIVDYKTGDRKFDPGEVWAGTSLQLPLYTAAAAQKGTEAAGMYYMPLYLPLGKEGEEKKHMLRGVTSSDEASLEAAERNMEEKSSIIEGLKRNKDGSWGGALCTRREMEELIQTAVKKAGETADALMRGEAGILPCNEKTCEFCPYKSVCRFDTELPGCRYKNPAKMTLDELLGRIQEEKTKGKGGEKA